MAKTNPSFAGDLNAIQGEVESDVSTILQLANGAQVEDFERGTWNSRTVYEAAFKRNGQHTEVQVLDDGTVLTKSLPTAAGAPAAGTSGVNQK